MFVAARESASNRQQARQNVTSACGRFPTFADNPIRSPERLLLMKADIRNQQT